MLPSDIYNAACDLYNAVGDSYFSETLMLNWIWQGCHELAKKAWINEVLYTGTTTANQQTYSYPTNAIAIKRVSVNGKKLKRYTFRDDDAITLSNQSIVTTGWPIYYTDWDFSINMRPIPDSNYVLDIYYFSDEPQITSPSQELITPTLFHFDLVDYLLWRMFAKDKDIANMTLHAQLWQEHVKDCVAYKARLKKTDSFKTVQSEDTLPVTIMGEA